jgi:hypothetical protein
MSDRRRNVFARLLTAAVLAALVLPGVAQAHHTAVPIVALDYGNRIVSGGASVPGVSATLRDEGRKISVTIGLGTGVVLGYEGEPFLLFDKFGVRASGKSETARSLGLVQGLTIRWTSVSESRTFVWPDARIWAPSGALHGRDHVAWSIPIVVNGARTAIRGQLTKADTPQLWPWLLLGALPLLATALAVRRRRWLWATATGLAAVAGFATLANLGGFAFGGLPMSSDRWVLLAAEVVLSLVAIGVLGMPRARLVAVAALAAFAVLQALSELSVFRHGIVVSGLPATAVRAAAAIALGAGIGAAALVFLAPTPQTRNTFSPVRRPRKEQA